MVLHHAVMGGLSGIKAHSAHHVGASKVAAGGGGGGGGGGSSAASHAIEYVAIFATIKAFGYTGATYLWSTTMGAMVGGPVGAIVGAAMAQNIHHERSQAAKEQPEEVEEETVEVGDKVEFHDLEGDLNTFERREQGGLWYKPKTGETILVEQLEYKNFERALYVERWRMPIRSGEEEDIIKKLRALCNATGTSHRGLEKARPLTGGEKEAMQRGCLAGCCLGCGAGGACGAGVGWTVLQCGEIGGNTIVGNVAQTLMIKHITCPAASCCGAIGGASVGACTGCCCAGTPDRADS